MNEKPTPPMMMGDPIISTDSPWYKWMIDAGLLRPDEQARRIIIDIEKGEAVKIWVEKFGGQGLELAPPQVR